MPFRFFLQESVSCGTRKWDEYGQKIAIKSDFVLSHHHTAHFPPDSDTTIPNIEKKTTLFITLEA